MAKVSSAPSVMDSQCPSRLVLDRIADKWTALIIQLLSRKTMRYAELHREIGGISQKMLTQTLRILERDGLVERKVFPVVPPKVEYSLSRLGRTLIEPLRALCRWSEKHLPELSESRACSSPGGERPVRSCVTRFLINNATGGNDCAVVRPGGGTRRHRAKDHAAVSSRIGARRIGFEFCSAFAGGETQSGHCLLFLFAAAHLSGGSFHFVARFSEKSSADPVARDRIGL